MTQVVPDSIAPQQWSKRAAARKGIRFNVSGEMDPTDTLTGTPTVSVSPATGLVVNTLGINSATQGMLGKRPAAGKVITAKAQTGSSPGVYTLTFQCNTLQGDVVVASCVLTVI